MNHQIKTFSVIGEKLRIVKLYDPITNCYRNFYKYSYTAFNNITSGTLNLVYYYFYFFGIGISVYVRSI